MTVGSQMPELNPGGGGLFCCPYNIGSQNTPYKSGLKVKIMTRNMMFL